MNASDKDTQNIGVSWRKPAYFQEEKGNVPRAESCADPFSGDWFFLKVID